MKIGNNQNIQAELSRINRELELLKLNQAVTHFSSLSYTGDSFADRHEYRVFSQSGDDGIIQFLINRIPSPNKTFIEFGVEDFTEANCRFLMMYSNWSGFVVDGSQSQVEKIVNHPDFWRYDLRATQSMITAENVNAVLDKSGFAGKLGILSIDIDGMDYWVLDRIELQPEILIVEYNSVFGADRAITVPYRADFVRTKAHHSNLYFGASLAAITELATKKGFAFVGCNSIGSNAFFVRDDMLAPSKLRRLEVIDAFVESKFRESRNEHGSLTLLRAQERMREISGLPVFNTRTGELEPL